MIKITRTVENTMIKDSYNDTARIEIEDDDSISFYMGDNDDPIFSTTAKEFLDLVVACWPDNVAYQFKDQE